MKRTGQARLEDINRNIPTTRRWARGDPGLQHVRDSSRSTAAFDPRWQALPHAVLSFPVNERSESVRMVAWLCSPGYDSSRQSSRELVWFPPFASLLRKALPRVRGEHSPYTRRERERERERERDRQTDRQTDRQRQRRRETETERIR